MSAQHTPGPWTICEHSWSDTSIFHGKSKRIAKLSIYDVATEETQQALEREMDANARLIAAAPELLEIAERFLDEIDQDDTTIDLHVAAREAVAKAKGGVS